MQSTAKLPPFRDAPWLTRLRWIAIEGQLVTLAILKWIGAADLHMPAILTIEAIILLSNILLYRFRKHPLLQSPRATLAILFADTLLLTALLAFSGGAMNPYTIFYLVHVVMAAVLLGGATTWIIAATCAAGYASLFLLVPISPHYMHNDAFIGHLYGMLSSFVIAALCTGYFVHLMQQERTRAQLEAQAARDAAAKAESFASLTAIAAGAAHELATPLATIAVAARELERAAAKFPQADALAEDARLIREEVDRCRTILDALSPAQNEESADLSPDALIKSLLARINTASQHRITLDRIDGPSVRLPKQRTTQAAAALLQNALDLPTSRVHLRCEVANHQFTFHIRDDGPGIPPTALARLGEPFFTTKPHGRGLGLFLVRQFVDGLDGHLSIESTPGEGTSIRMVLPLSNGDV